MIAGFDTESLSNNSSYCNGYGITMIPRSHITKSSMADRATGYVGTDVYKTLLPSIATQLQNVLGNHLINRHVLLASTSTSWSWRSQYLTLMSDVQVFGYIYASNYIHVGEAYIKLPVFNFINTNEAAVSYWLRASTSDSSFANVNSVGNPNTCTSSLSLGIRPLMYIR